MSAAKRAGAGGLHPAQLLALAFGAVYLLVGLVGFFVTGFDQFAGHTDERLVGFELNPLHNIVHILTGLAGLLLWRSLPGTRVFGWTIAVVFGVVVLYGLFAVGSADLNLLSLNAADNWLHFFTAALGLAMALWPTRSEVRG